MGYLSSERDKPFWVVLDGCDEPLKGFCRGHGEEGEAKRDAEDRNGRARGLGITATYSVVPKP